jgi:hypothetical protein
MLNLKKCAKCGLGKDARGDFYWDKRRDQPHCWCKACLSAYNCARAKANPQVHNARSKAWREKNPERFREIALANYYRDPERSRRNRVWSQFRVEFRELWEAQKGLCACCDEPMLESGTEHDSVVVDHDRACCPGKRSCGKCVRGLIHWRCNVLLGHVQDNPTRLEKAARYLQRWAEKPTREVLEPVLMGPDFEVTS